MMGLAASGASEGTTGAAGAKGFHHGVASRSETRVVLDVALGEPLIGFVPMAVGQQVDDDMHRGLLVLVENRIFIGKQGRGIGDSHNGSGLAEHIDARQREEQPNSKDVFHGRYTQATQVTVSSEMAHTAPLSWPKPIQRRW